MDDRSGWRADIVEVLCPYCHSAVQLLLDTGGASEQRYVEDCEVCCRPWSVDVSWGPGGEAQVLLTPENE